MHKEPSHLRKLTKCLFVSGVLNIALASYFFYSLIRERPPTPYFESKPATREEQQAPFAIDQNNAELIRYFKHLSFDQLVAKLSRKELVESGFTVRDLSLASLIAFHHFDLSRALLDDILPKQIRTIFYGVKKDGKPAKVFVYPGLSDKQYESIISFAKKERWPLTPKGLFLSLKTEKNKHNLSLADAFYLTQEFIAVEMLFSRSDLMVQKKEILHVLLDGSFAMLSNFLEQQKQSHDLSFARRQHFLLEYVKHQSKTAAYLLLKTDGPAIVRKLDDTHIKMILSLLTEKTEDANKFALTLLTSPRGDSVWQMAAAKLYEYAGEAIPEKFQHHAALSKFLPAYINLTKKEEPENLALSQPIDAPIKRENQIHTVQEGDSLWKISRRYNVDIDLLRQQNQLSSDILKPGTTLKIP